MLRYRNALQHPFSFQIGPLAMKAIFRRASPQFRRLLFTAVALAVAPLTIAAQLDINGPAGSEFFAGTVTVLPNGNVVVSDRWFDLPGPVQDVGAVHLYSPDMTLISTLTGTAPFDQVGSRVSVLANGNYVIESSSWNQSRGAVTWGSAINGISGVISAANSLIGSSIGDGYSMTLAPLSNGNYLVSNPSWDAISQSVVSDAGAITWGNGNGGTVGLVSSANSLVGASANDSLGSALMVLSNDNYVLSLPNWDASSVGASAAVIDVGAVAWGNGSTGSTGVIGASNALIGARARDGLGSTVTTLPNGNYVAVFPRWDASSSVPDVGAVAWGNGSSGSVGVLSAANSLVGVREYDTAGSGGVTVLSAGNYVVRSPSWDASASVANVGAVTWGNGSSGSNGLVSSVNSLIGGRPNDGVGDAVIALSNGNYVVRSRLWDASSPVVLSDVGAVTWGNGAIGTAGVVSPGNSLVGSTAKDGLNNSVVALNNGNYVVGAPNWDAVSPVVVNVGAAAWGNGNGGTVGVINAANSLLGTSAGDFVGLSITPLSNGHYTVNSRSWNATSPLQTGVGAVTWANGNGGTAGVVSMANSLVGGTSGDAIGTRVVALSNGHYVVQSQFWDGVGPSVSNVGSVTWGDGYSGATTGLVSTDNSLVGTSANDGLGSGGITILNNSNYVVSSADWDATSPAMTDVGAVTWGNGDGGTIGSVSVENSLVGTSPGDRIGGSAITTLNNGNYVVSAPNWDATSPAVLNVGAVTWGNGLGGTRGLVSAENSLIGITANDSVGNGGIGVLQNGRYFVRSPMWYSVPLAKQAGVLTFGAADGSIVGPVGAGNSVLSVSTKGGFVMFVTDDLNAQRTLVGRPYDNVLTIVN
jgi:Repeat of unknown function (DUF5650)